MTKIVCNYCETDDRKPSKMKVQLRNEKGEGVLWCQKCGSICKTQIVARDPMNEKIIGWEPSETMGYL